MSSSQNARADLALGREVNPLYVRVSLRLKVWEAEGERAGIKIPGQC